VDEPGYAVDEGTIDDGSWQHYFADQVFGRFARRVRRHTGKCRLVDQGVWTVALADDDDIAGIPTGLRRNDRRVTAVARGHYVCGRDVQQTAAGR